MLDDAPLGARRILRRHVRRRMPGRGDRLGLDDLAAGGAVQLPLARLGAGDLLCDDPLAVLVPLRGDLVRLQHLAADLADALLAAGLGARWFLHCLPRPGIVIGDRQLVAGLGRLVGIRLGDLRGNDRLADALDGDLAGRGVDGRYVLVVTGVDHRAKRENLDGQPVGERAADLVGVPFDLAMGKRQHDVVLLERECDGVRGGRRGLVLPVVLHDVDRILAVLGDLERLFRSALDLLATLVPLVGIGGAAERVRRVRRKDHRVAGMRILIGLICRDGDVRGVELPLGREREVARHRDGELHRVAVGIGPAGERVAGARCHELRDLLAMVDRQIVERLAAVRVQRDRIALDAPLGDQLEVARHRVVEIELVERAGDIPPEELTALLGGILVHGGFGTVLLHPPRNCAQISANAHL